MLEFIDIGVENVIAYRVGGKITEAEMKSVTKLFREKVDGGEKLYIYQEVTSIGGVEFDALVEKMKLFYDIGLSHFSRIAVVTPNKWMSRLIDLEGKFFNKIDMKGFSSDEKELAILFLSKE